MFGMKALTFMNSTTLDCCIKLLQRAKSCSSVSSSVDDTPDCGLLNWGLVSHDMSIFSLSLLLQGYDGIYLLALVPDDGGCGFCVVSLKTSYFPLVWLFWLALTNFSTSDSSCGSSAPTIRDKSWWPLKMTKQGTEETSKDSATSGKLSASICATQTC
jgi:hypothetical protein